MSLTKKDRRAMSLAAPKCKCGNQPPLGRELCGRCEVEEDYKNGRWMTRGRLVELLQDVGCEYAYAHEVVADLLGDTE